MTRSPLLYAMGRGMEMDAGGSAELQTDVMRFMAILSLCLVAIFALVQSLPPGPVKTEAHPVPTEAPVAFVEETPQPTADPETVTRTEKKSVTPAGNLGTVTKSEKKPVAPEATPLPAKLVTVPKAPAPVDAPSKQGFTLQFEDDAALTRLISTDEVGFFAITADKSMRLSIDGNKMNFWPSSAPAQFHEMDGSTVPAEVKRALLRSGAALAGSPKWGVTLPPATAGDLSRMLTETSGGSLIIGRNGQLRLEP